MLSDNDAAAYAYVNQIWAKMIKHYEEAFDQLEITETDAFGENLYFHRKKLGLPMGSDDNSQGIKEMEDVDEDTDEDM